MRKLSKIFFSVILIALFVFSSFAVNAQGLSNSYNYLAVNAAYDPMTISANITLTKKPYCIAINNETNRVYVGVENGLLVIHGDTNQIIADIPLNDNAIALAVNPVTNRIYVGVYGENMVVLDGATNQKVGEIAEELFDSYELTVNPITNRVYVSDRSIVVGEADSVSVYNGETLQFVTSVALGLTTSMEDIGVAVNPSTNKVYATWTGNHSLFMIDGNTNQVTKNVIPSTFSNEIMVNPYTGYVYPGTTVLNGATLAQVNPSLTSTVVAVDPIHNFLYSVYSFHTLYRLNGSTHSIIDSLSPQWTFYTTIDSAAVNSKSSKVYLIHNLESHPIEVIPEFPLLTPMLLAVFALATVMIAFKRRMFRTKRLDEVI